MIRDKEIRESMGHPIWVRKACLWNEILLNLREDVEIFYSSNDGWIVNIPEEGKKINWSYFYQATFSILPLLKKYLKEKLDKTEER